MYIRILNPLEIRKEKEELKFKSLESTNCQNHSDVIVSGVTIASPDSGVTIREREANRPVAGKRYAQKRLFMPKLGFSKSLFRLCSQTFILITLILSMIISVVGGLFNVKLPERKSTVGTSSELLSCYRFRSSSTLFILREFLANIISINGELCFCKNKEMILNDNKQLKDA